MDSGFSISKINSAKLMAELPREKVFNGREWVLVATVDAAYKARATKKKIDENNKRAKVDKKTRIVKKTKGSYDVYGVYQERF